MSDKKMAGIDIEVSEVGLRDGLQSIINYLLPYS